MRENEQLRVSQRMEVVDAAVMSSLDSSSSFYSIPLEGTPISLLQFQYKREIPHSVVVEYQLRYLLEGRLYIEGNGDIGRVILRRLSDEETAITIEDSLWRNADEADIYSNTYWPPQRMPLDRTTKAISREESMKKKREGIAFMLDIRDNVIARLKEDLGRDGILKVSGSLTKETTSLATETADLIPIDIVTGSRGYIVRVTHQVNGCYKQGWYDACAVMLRRLIETLIIECYEHHGIEDNIKDKGNYLYLEDLIAKFISETTWTVGRNARSSLPQLKSLGDQSAHNRRFIAQRQDIDKLAGQLRLVIQELFYIAGFDKTTGKSKS